MIKQNVSYIDFTRQINFKIYSNKIQMACHKELNSVEWDGALSFVEECVNNVIEKRVFGFHKFSNDQYSCSFVLNSLTNPDVSAIIKRQPSLETESIGEGLNG